MDQDKLLQQFSQRAVAALGPRIESIVLYGSAATGEFDPGRSDLNLLVLLGEVDAAALSAARPLLHWWLGQGYSWPLLMGVEEFLSSADVFPMELCDIFAKHQLIHGRFDFPAPQIDPRLHRAQLEHELRTKLLRLRQKAIAVYDEPKELLRLMENSLPTFLLLLRHCLLLAGQAAGFARRENLGLAEAHFGLSGEAFRTLLDTRQGLLSPRSIDSVQLFQSYLAQVQFLVHLADRLPEPRP